MTVPEKLLTITVNHRVVEVGTEVSVEGVRGRCRFIAAYRNGPNEWVDVETSRGFIRSFRPDAITTVHRKGKKAS